jgi:hypothetical protein
VDPAVTTSMRRRLRPTLSDRTLRAAAWVQLGFLVAVYAVGIGLSFANGPARAPGQATAGDAPDFAFALMVVSFPVVGLLILRRQPRNTIGWLLLAIGTVWGLSGLAESYARYGLVVDPGSLPAAGVVLALTIGSWAPGIGLMGSFLVLLYPDGHLPSPRWRAVAWLSAVTIVAITFLVDVSPGPIEVGPAPDIVNPLGLESARPALDVLMFVVLPLLPVCFVASAVALMRRFHRATGLERLQLKWLATAGALVASVYFLALAGSLLKPDPFSGRDPEWLKVLQSAAGLSFVLLPIAIGVAILRYRLYDIDLVINRTLVYGLLTVTLGAVYLGSVLVLQLALRPLTDQSDLAVAASTLGVAALFRPARARIQSAVDRRFYRSRYDATRTLESFADRLRHELDLEAVAVDLRDAVRDTVQPAHVSLWLRP